MYLAFMLASGVFWTATYILIIWRNFQDRSYGMPLAALCANISWECIFSFIFPSQGIQRVVNIVWFSLDAVILFHLLRYGPREFADLSKRVFYVFCGLTLVTYFAAVLLVTMEFHDGGVYSAFGQNLIMSALFLAMLYRRRSLRGQSIGIALCKLLGTLAASLAFALYSSYAHTSVLLPFLYISTFIYDAIYVGLVYRQQRIEAWVPAEKAKAFTKLAMQAE